MTGLSDPVTVVTLADDAYALPLAVMVRSLLDHFAPERELALVIIDGGLTTASKARLENSWRDSAAWPRTLVRYVAPRLTGTLRAPLWGRVIRLTYERLAVADHVPPGLGRALFFDSDMLVLADVGVLAGLDLDGATIAAVQDPFIPFVSSIGGLVSHGALSLPANTPYFNAGLMVIELARWRAEDIGRRAVDFTQRWSSSLQQYDQDSLNAVLAGRWKRLAPHWQVQPRIVNSGGLRPAGDPAVVHFSGRLKPWLYRGRDRTDELFEVFVDRTAWRGTRPPHTLRAAAMRLYDSPVRRLLYPLERRILARGWPARRLAPDTGYSERPSDSEG